MQPHLKTLLTLFALILILPTQLMAGPIQGQVDPVVAQRQAIQALDAVLERRRKTGDIAGTKPDLMSIGRELVNTHKAFVERGDWEPASVGAAKLGHVLRLLDMPSEAKQSFELALLHADRAKHVGHKIKALLGLAKTELYRTGTRDLHGVVGQNADQATALAAIAGETESLCDSYQVSAELFLELREYTAALNSINESFPLAANLKDPMYLFYAHQTRGAIYSERAGQCDYDRDAANCALWLDKAKEDFEKARAIMRNLEYTALMNLMDQLLKNVEQKRTLAKLKETDRRLSLEMANLQKKFPVHVSETFLPPKTSDSLAAPELNRLKPLLEEQISRASDGATGNFLRGSLKDLLDERDAALDYYLKAVKLLNSDSASLRADRSLGSFLEDKIQIYYHPMLHMLERKRYAEAFDLMENSRTRAMSDLLRSQDVNLRPQDRNLYAEYLTITAKLSLAQQNVLRKQQAGSEKEVQDLEAELQNVLQRLTAANSNLAGLIAPQTANLETLRQSMKRDGYEAFYYVVLDKQLIIWHLSGEQTHVLSVFLSRLDLIKKVDLLRKSLDKDEEFDQQTAGELFRFLIQPILKWVKSDRLVIIPHEDLNYVPFQVLYNAENKKYLGEMFQLSYAPSATILSRLKKVENIRAGNLLAVDSTNLEAGENEVKALGQLFSGRSKIVVDKDLKKSDLNAWIANYDLVHLSIHGRFNPTEPLFSFLKLNQGNENDDLLTTAEMFGLPLSRAQLVVLSSCETGQAKATRANEIIGMQRALLYAGANNLILPAWKVDPESTELWMTTFYREAQSKSFSEASRLASMTVKNNSKYSHPYFWSPFLLIGK